ncbi:MAG: pantoate kinase [Candidatus Hydrothermarchaeota archaeon]
MRANVFVPGHITGFFEICEDPDPLRSGSRGCGIVINKGVYTTVEAREGEVDEIRTHVNGEAFDCPVTRTALEELLRGQGGRYRVEVFHELEVPMKYGFGTSAAGTLGATIALARALGLETTLNHCGRIAHRAEVLNRTGLGDVIAECTGGVVIRERPGGPGIGMTDRLLSNDYVVAFVVGGELETSSVLLDERRKEAINRAGGECMDLLLRNPSMDNFLKLSKRFSSQIDMMDEKVKGAIKTLEEKGVPASMIMLGNSIFTLTNEPERVCELLDYMYVVAEIDYVGARVL